MSAPPEPHRATYEDLLKVPDIFVAELIDGELYTWPRPAAPHLTVQKRLILTLAPGYEDGDGGPGGWVFYFEPELHLGDDVLVPDIAGWRRERLPFEADTVAFKIPPDWVCEVISERTGRIDRVKKLPIYGRYGVPYAWIVDPRQRTLEAYRLADRARWLLLGVFGGETLSVIEPFEEITIPLSRLWLGPEPPQTA